MTLPLIAVAGAAGRTGANVVAELRAAEYPVRALVRRSDSRAARLSALGAEVMVADLFDPPQAERALRGVQRAYFATSFHPHMLHGAVSFALAAQRNRLESVVALSQWLAGPSHPALGSRQHWLADQVFGLVPNLAYTIVAPGFFAAYPYLRLMDYGAPLGLFPFPAQESSRDAPASNEDIARVAAAALQNPAHHAGATYRPTGPALLSIAEMAAIMSQVLGHRMRHLRLPLWMFHKAARADGVDPFELYGLASYLADLDSGAFSHAAPTAHVEQVTGRAPEDFATLTRRHASAHTPRPGVVATTDSLLRFLAVPFRPGFNPASYARRMRLPEAATPLLAMNNPAWRADRAAAAQFPHLVRAA